MARPQANLQRLGEAAVENLQRQEWLEPLADKLQRAVVATFQAGGETGRRIRDFLHGTWLGHPLHPVLTDVPLGAWTVATLLDLAGEDNRHQDRAADAAIGIGLAGAVGAAVTGMTDWQHTAAEERRVGMVHGLLNVSATALYAISLALRLRGARTAGRTIGGLGFTVALGAAYLGGHLVYRKRIGVDHAPRADWSDFVAALPEAQLRESVPQRVDVRGVPVVLIRRAGRMYADSCAHLGGPLSEDRSTMWRFDARGTDRVLRSTTALFSRGHLLSRSRVLTSAFGPDRSRCVHAADGLGRYANAHSNAVRSGQG